MISNTFKTLAHHTNGGKMKYQKLSRVFSSFSSTSKRLFSSGTFYGITSSHGNFLTQMPEIQDFDRFFLKYNYKECKSAMQRFMQVADSFGDANLKMEGLLRLAKIAQCEGNFIEEQRLLKELLVLFEQTMPLESCSTEDTNTNTNLTSTSCKGFSLQQGKVDEFIKATEPYLEKLTTTNSNNIKSVKNDDSKLLNTTDITKDVTIQFVSNSQLTAWNQVLSAYLFTCLRLKLYNELQNTILTYLPTMEKINNLEGVYICYIFDAYQHHTLFEEAETRRSILQALLSYELSQNSLGNNSIEQAKDDENKVNEKKKPITKLTFTKVNPNDKEKNEDKEKNQDQEHDKKEIKTKKMTPDEQREYLASETSSTTHTSIESEKKEQKTVEIIETKTKLHDNTSSTNKKILSPTIHLNLIKYFKNIHDADFNISDTSSLYDSIYPLSIRHHHSLTDDNTSTNPTTISLQDAITKAKKEAIQSFEETLQKYLLNLQYALKNKSITQITSTLVTITVLLRAFTATVPEFLPYSDAFSREVGDYLGIVYPSFRPSTFNSTTESYLECQRWYSDFTMSLPSSVSITPSLLHINFYGAQIPILPYLLTSRSISDISYGLTLVESLLPNDILALGSTLRYLSDFYSTVNPVNAEGLSRSAIKHIERNLSTYHTREQYSSILGSSASLLNTLSWDGKLRTSESIKILQKAATDGLLTEPKKVCQHCDGIFTTISGSHSFIIFLKKQPNTEVATKITTKITTLEELKNIPQNDLEKYQLLSTTNTLSHFMKSDFMVEKYSI